MTEQASTDQTMSDTDLDGVITRTLAGLRSVRRAPTSTYRLQFHKGFGFRDAAAIVPYLRDLGVTHCYASPYLKATPGSTHGYDVVDHARLNDELGTRDDYDAWLAAMREAGIRHILDTVPNHMGVGSNENPAWNDLLEDGPSSVHGSFFDVVWQNSPRPELRDRVLIPSLGIPYGTVLEKGELKVVYVDDGSFALAYYDRRFPISPATYDAILDGADADVARGCDSDARAAWSELVDAIRSLPPADRGDFDTTARRDAAKRNIKRQIKSLFERCTPARTAVDAALGRLNGSAGDAASFNRLDALIARQNYRLAYWRTASDEINYRRFFDVDSLAGLSMERPEVFEAAHALFLDLAADGHISGLRIDHSDGLLDPAEYFVRLQRAYLTRCVRRAIEKQGGTVDIDRLADRVAHHLQSESPPGPLPLYVVTEKILAPHEPLPAAWAMHGTSGYDVLNEINGLFVDPAGEATLDACYRNFVGDDVPAVYRDLAYQQKRRVLSRSFASELNLLAHQADRLAQLDRHSQDFTLDTLREALRELVACFGVYRTYVTIAGASERDAAVLDEAIAAATKRAEGVVEPCVFAFLRDAILLNGRYGADLREQAVRFAGKFQQLTSPVTAKGLEDTAFYIYHRLISLNEVGGEPDRFGVSVASLHQTFADRQREWPDAMSVLSTHDTKRSEDVRARIHVLSELADDWATAVGQWHAITRPQDVHPNDEYLIYQTLIGAWPHDGRIDATFVDRILAYLQKAMREAKQRTSWTAPNERVEKAAEAFVRRILDADRGRDVQQVFLPLQQRVSRVGKINSLAQTLVRLTAPGVPDTYQGTELWDLSLVDPDNRRPVDYLRRQSLLAGLVDAPRCDDGDIDGQSKLWVTTQALRLRRERPELFARGEYRPLTVTGQHAASVFAFARAIGDQVAITIAPRCVARLVGDDGKLSADAWGDTSVQLPTGFTSLRCRLNGREVRQSHVPLRELLHILPVALITDA